MQCIFLIPLKEPAHRVICLGIRIHLSQDQPPVHALVLLLYNFRYFTEHFTLNLDFQKCIQALMTDVINTNVLIRKYIIM